MSHSYGGNVATSDLDWIRFQIQDTGPDSDSGEPWYFTDEEIAGIFAIHGTKLAAAVDILYTWARRLAHSPNFRIGRFSEDYATAAKTLNDKAAELDKMLSTATSGLYAGGVSVADKAAKRANTDRTQGAFRRGRFDNPRAGR